VVGLFFFAVALEALANPEQFGVANSTVNVHFSVQVLYQEPFDVADDVPAPYLRVRLAAGPGSEGATVSISCQGESSPPQALTNNNALIEIPTRPGRHTVVASLERDLSVVGSAQTEVTVPCCSREEDFPSPSGVLVDRHHVMWRSLGFMGFLDPEKGVTVLVVGSCSGPSAQWLLMHVVRDPSSKLVCLNGGLDSPSEAPRQTEVRSRLVHLELADLVASRHENIFHVAVMDITPDAHDTDTTPNLIVLWRLLRYGGLLIINGADGDNAVRVPRGVDVFADVWASEMSLMHASVRLPFVAQRAVWAHA